MKRVLIADDSMFMRMRIRKTIEKQGYTVVGEAVNGKDAIKQFQKYQPDIVTMDITMPEMNGIEAVKVLKVLNTDVKVVMVSALGTKYLMLEALQAGAVDFIIKPFSEEKIKECFDKIFV